MRLDNNQQAFISLVKGGLWESEVKLASLGMLNYSEIYRLAEEQAVVGLVAAGIEHVVDVKVPQEVALTFVGSALQLEQRNTAMNDFIASLIKKLRDKDIYTLLVKGQGVAQCYERPLWRASGDVDLLLNGDDYDRAMMCLTPFSSSVDEEIKERQHLALAIDNWTVELHGSLRSGLWKKLDQELNDLQRQIFYQGAVRSWKNGHTMIFLPWADEDIAFTFTHIMQHFFRGGIGLRQVCDWCRLLWCFREKFDEDLLEARIYKMGLMSEWKTFASLAVNYLGMPVKAMPFYSSSKKWNRKKDRVISLIIEAGNFGHNRDMSYINERSYIVRKAISLERLFSDGFKQMRIFPMDSVRVWNSLVFDGATRFMKGK